MIRKWVERFYAFVNPWGDLEFGRSRTGKERVRERLVRLFHFSQKEFKIRYLPVLQELEARPERYATILEVGSGSMGLSRFTRKKVVGVDPHIEGPRHPNMELIRGNATELPFPDGSFDLVVAMDVLEHVPSDLRPKVVAEVLRVAKKKIFVGFPSGPVSQKWEARVSERFQKNAAGWKKSAQQLEVYRRRFWFLAEHAEHGLPSREEMDGYLRAASGDFDREYERRVIGNESVWVWYFGVARMLNGNYFRWLLTTFLYVIFFHPLSRMTWPAPYRTIFVLDKK